MLKIVVPIFIGDEFIGAAGGCGVLLEGGEIDDFMINKTAGLDEELIEGLTRDIESIKNKTAKECARFVEKTVKQFVEEYETLSK